MNKRVTNQTISGAFVFIIGLAMFTLLGNNYKFPMLFLTIYLIAIIVQLVAMRINNKQKSKKNKLWVSSAFIFMGFACYFSVFIGSDVLNSLSKTWILLLFFVGVHFLFFIPANNYKYWNVQLLMVIFLVMNTVLGFLLYPTHLSLIFIIDGTIKMIYGAYMVYVTYLK